MKKAFTDIRKSQKLKKYVKSSVQTAQNMLEYVHAAAKED
jgi:hypothetical protein